MRWIGHLAAFTLVLATPAAAQGDDGLVRELRRFADITAGQQTGSATPVDKLIRFERRDGHLVVTAIAVAPPDEWPDLRTGEIALMRTRTAGGIGNLLPPNDDFDYVQRSGRHLFIVGEWTRPAPMWEIIREGDASIRFRSIGADGAPGPWLLPTVPPAGAR